MSFTGLGFLKAHFTLLAITVCFVCIVFTIVPLVITLSLLRDPQIVTILPLGDSITVGFRSEDGNGYRLSLSKALAKAGFPPFTCDIPPDSDSKRRCDLPDGWRRAHRFVGSQASGSMQNNRHEGHSGFTVSQIRRASTPMLESYCGAVSSAHEGSKTQRPWDKPDVVLLMAGTNDVIRNPLHEDIDATPTRLRGLIDFIGTTCPKAAIIVAQIVRTNDSMEKGAVDGEAHVEAFNAKLPALVQDLRAQGRNISLVDMTEVVGQADTVDGVHPDGPAYQRMGGVWLRGMQAVLPVLSGLGHGAISNTP